MYPDVIIIARAWRDSTAIVSRRQMYDHGDGSALLSFGNFVWNSGNYSNYSCFVFIVTENVFNFGLGIWHTFSTSGICAKLVFTTATVCRCRSSATRKIIIIILINYTMVGSSNKCAFEVGVWYTYYGQISLTGPSRAEARLGSTFLRWFRGGGEASRGAIEIWHVNASEASFLTPQLQLQVYLKERNV